MDGQLEQYAEMLEAIKVSNPEQYAKIMQKLSGSLNNTAPADSIRVVPDPAFVIKTFITAAPNQNQGVPGDKVFVNVCSSDHISAFSQRKTIDNDGNEREGISIPLSLGPESNDVDHAGKQCCVFDCVVNPGVITDCEADSSGSFRNFVCELALQYVEKKYGYSLSHEYRLPKLKYKGNVVREQVVRNRPKAPGIQEVDVTQNSKLRNAAILGAAQSNGALSGERANSFPMNKSVGPQRRLGTLDLRTTEDEQKASPLHAMQSVMTESDSKPTDDADVSQAVRTAVSRPATPKSLIQEVSDEDISRRTSSQVSNSGPEQKDELLRATSTRRLEPKQKFVPKSNLQTSIHLVNSTNVKLFNISTWDFVPLNFCPASSQPDPKSIPSAIVVELKCDTTQPDYVAFRNNARNTEILNVSDTNSQCTIKCTQERLIITLPGHVPAHITLPIILPDKCDSIKSVELSASTLHGADDAQLHSEIAAAAEKHSGISAVFLITSNRLLLGCKVQPVVYEDHKTHEPDPGSKIWLRQHQITIDRTDASSVTFSKPDVPIPVQDDDELPEDAFLRQDTMSQYYLQQRAETKQKKQEEEKQHQAAKALHRQQLLASARARFSKLQSAHQVDTMSHTQIIRSITSKMPDQELQTASIAMTRLF